MSPGKPVGQMMHGGQGGETLGRSQPYRMAGLLQSRAEGQKGLHIAPAAEGYQDDVHGMGFPAVLLWRLL